MPILILAGLVAIGVWSFIRQDTDAALQSQRQTEQKAELQALTDFKAWLAAQKSTPDPLATRAFLSQPIIDSVLSAFDGIELKLLEAQDITLKLKSVRSDFRAGFPGLTIVATAEKSGVTADVSTVARLEPVFDSNTLRLKVHVDSLVPKISWRFIDFNVRGLVRDLLQAKVVEAINRDDALGVVSVPLSQSQTFALPSTQIPFTTTGVKAVMTLPSFSGTVTAHLSRVVAMPEGIYVYATLDTGTK
ncbi:hypothetical protein NKJ72_19920 [Mesorhizobium sp. M0045]|uniref:hypothetical protein n=1 Tax=Mesorhizobium sp. M0045 TaxID=2956857 RepID=UPI00333947BB